MDRRDPTEVLSELLRLLYRSLPLYLRGKHPWVRWQHGEGLDALDHIAADDSLYSKRLADAIQERNGRIDVGQFPVSYTAIHDLSLDYLLPRVAGELRERIGHVERWIADLAGEPLLRALAEEILGNARGHLETLTELLRPTSSGREPA